MGEARKLSAPLDDARRAWRAAKASVADAKVAFRDAPSFKTECDLWRADRESFRCAGALVDAIREIAENKEDFFRIQIALVLLNGD
jgi:hypothetical protein